MDRNTVTILVLLVCWFSTSWALFPDQFEMNSFLFNTPPKTYENDFFNPKVRLQNDDDFKFGPAAVENAPSSPTVGGVLVSQNRKYLAKTPEHDKHFQAILRQQDAATIKDPGQAAMVASDQMELRDRLGVRHSLQTSDDDIYEVESAPMMKSTPYRSGRSERYRKREPQHEPTEQSEQQDVELPVSVSFQSNIDHAYEPKPQQKRNRVYEKFLEDGEPTEPNYHQQPRGQYSPRQYRQPQSENMHFALGNQMADEENNVSPYQRPSRGSGNGQRAKHASTYHHSPYQSVQYTQVPATENYQPETKPRYYQQQADEYRTGQFLSSPTSGSQHLHERDMSSPQTSPNKYDKNPMESSWLDMGAYSSGKGAFGWYSDVPVSGPHGHGHGHAHKK